MILGVQKSRFTGYQEFRGVGSKDTMEYRGVSLQDTRSIEEQVYRIPRVYTSKYRILEIKRSTEEQVYRILRVQRSWFPEYQEYTGVGLQDTRSIEEQVYRIPRVQTSRYRILEIKSSTEEQVHRIPRSKEEQVYRLLGVQRSRCTRCTKRCRFTKPEVQSRREVWIMAFKFQCAGVQEYMKICKAIFK